MIGPCYDEGKGRMMTSRTKILVKTCYKRVINLFKLNSN